MLAARPRTGHATRSGRLVVLGSTAGAPLARASGAGVAAVARTAGDVLQIAVHLVGLELLLLRFFIAVILFVCHYLLPTVMVKLAREAKTCAGPCRSG